MFAPAMRRYHSREWEQIDCAALHARGVRAVTLHQGVEANPYINYPFHDATLQRLREYSANCAAVGVDVSVYYTHRELSRHATPSVQRNDLIFENG